MRKNRTIDQQQEFSILTLDDDLLMTETLQSYFQSVGYRVDMENDPVRAIERIRNGNYDILLLDFLMRPICGDEVVRQIREFNQELFIILLTGHKSMAPPIQTIRELDIQGYYEKSERFDQLELLVESCAKSIRQMRTIRRYRDGLANILNQIPALSYQQETQGVLDTTLDQLTKILPGSDAFVYFNLAKISDPRLSELHEYSRLFKGTGSLENAQETAAVICEKYTWNDQKALDLPEDKLLVSPLFSNRIPYGILAVQYDKKPTREGAQLLEVYAKQVGALVSNLLLRTVLQLQNEELRRNYLETINVIRQFVDAKDFYTRGHSDRVSFYAVLIARKMNKDEKYTERLRLAGLFHDIGKIGIPDMILKKDGKLSDEEYSRLRQHPLIGKKILSTMSSYSDILPVIESHHERVDGTGYPFGLKGDSIPEEARIISVADAFDAMTSKRVYRDALSLPEAISEIRHGMGTQFDIPAAEAFLEILKDPDSLEAGLDKKFAGDAITFKR